MSAEPVSRYPLQWPTGWKRTASRRSGSFGKTRWRASSANPQESVSYKGDLSVAEAVARIYSELRRMGIGDWAIVISTNLRTRLDGLPRSDQAQPADPGVAVYWVDEHDARRCMAIDLYDKVEHNLAAVAATIEAMRAIERHGGAEILDRAFTGFTALPPPIAAQRPWREVLECGARDATVDGVQEAYRRMRSKAHPDKGGTETAFLAVQAAYEQAARELGFSP